MYKEGILLLMQHQLIEYKKTLKKLALLENLRDSGSLLSDKKVKELQLLKEECMNFQEFFDLYDMKVGSVYISDISKEIEKVFLLNRKEKK